MREFHYNNDELMCEDLSLASVAAQYGTPLYVYSAGSIRDHCRSIEQAFGGTEHLSCYAIKANANPGVLALLAGEGIGADAGSIGELRLALDAGFAPGMITLSGVGKADDEIAAALGYGVLALNVESAEELGVIRSIARSMDRRAPVCLRVNIELKPDVHPYVATATRGSKFGMGHDEAMRLFREAGSWPEIDVLGIHSHIGSQIIDAGTFLAAAERLVGLAAEVRAVGVAVRMVNFGGGFGVQYHDYVTHPLLPRETAPVDEGITTVGMLRAMLPVLKRAGCRILIQPGRSIVAHGGILLTKVVYTKRNGEKNFVVVDAGMNDLIRPSLYGSYHQIVPVRLRGSGVQTVDVVGPLCESGDFFAQDRPLPAAIRGELLAILCTGAYGYVLASNYNGRPRPAEVLVEGGSSAVIRNRDDIGRRKESQGHERV